ncbi:hypothetical protein ACIGKG_13260 [Streptomyces rochei]|uniref:Uncharacterized protein n=1 Tax=Streptomyces vinaceusdrappus TaxID=67376 RepID=A0ABY6BZ78_9ACTN|nr:MULTISPECIES: hypothetical protein [Streptomyces]MBJ6621461.1 hypothetical protein [Streptomyces sp. DHE17-7]UXI80842.1 hypothetical protein N6Q81_23820 [Streptomyces vinaceusdrappus]
MVGTAIDQYIQNNNGSVFQTIIKNESIDEDTKRNVRKLAVSSPQMLAKIDEMLKESGDVKAAAALVRDASDILNGKGDSATQFTDAGDDPMFPGKGERELRKAIASPFLLLAVIVALILWL